MFLFLFSFFMNTSYQIGDKMSTELFYKYMIVLTFITEMDIQIQDGERDKGLTHL